MHTRLYDETHTYTHKHTHTHMKNFNTFDISMAYMS